MLNSGSPVTGVKVVRVSAFPPHLIVVNILPVEGPTIMKSLEWPTSSSSDTYDFILSDKLPTDPYEKCSTVAQNDI